jgi:hypothetical protein
MRGSHRESGILYYPPCHILNVVSLVKDEDTTPDIHLHGHPVIQASSTVYLLDQRAPGIGSQAHWAYQYINISRWLRTCAICTPHLTSASRRYEYGQNTYETYTIDTRVNTFGIPTMHAWVLHQGAHALPACLN